MTLNTYLSTLETSGLIRVAQLQPELEYLFRHALVLDAAYESLLKQDRKRLHHDVGHALEALYPDRQAELSAELARHFEQAGELDIAAMWYQRAGERAAAQFANAEAVMYLSRALEMTDPTDLKTRYALAAAREQVHHLQGTRPVQQADLELLAALADQIDNPLRRAEVALRRTQYEIAVSHYAEAVLAAQQAIGLAESAGASEVAARGYLWLGIVLWHQSEFAAARAPLEEALKRAREAGWADLEADSLRNLGVIAGYQDNSTEAEGYLKEALPIFQRLGNRRGEGQALNSLGIIAYDFHHFDEARNYLGQALAIRREVGDTFGISATLANLAVVAFADHEY